MIWDLEIIMHNKHISYQKFTFIPCKIQLVTLKTLFFPLCIRSWILAAPSDVTLILNLAITKRALIANTNEVRWRLRKFKSSVIGRIMLLWSNENLVIEFTAVRKRLSHKILKEHMTMPKVDMGSGSEMSQLLLLTSFSQNSLLIIIQVTKTSPKFSCTRTL